MNNWIWMLAAAAAMGQEATLIRNATIHPVTGPEIAKGSVLIVGDRIKEIGTAVKAPPKAKIVEGAGLHLYPGLIDSGTTIGIEEVQAVRETNDLTELGEFNPQLRALIQVNPASEHVRVTRANGVTNVITMIRGGTIGGQAALLHLDGWTWEEMEAKRTAATYLNFPAIRTSSFTFGEGASTRGFTEAKRQQEEKLKELRDFFEQARRYQKAKDANGPGFRVDNRLEAMLPILERRTQMMVNAANEREIRQAIAFAEEQRIQIVLSGVRDPGKALDLMKDKKVAVILGPTLTLPNYEDDAFFQASVLPQEFAKRGIPFAFASFNSQFARNLPYQAGNAVGFGLSEQAALEAVTINAARIWGVDKDLGSIEAGKLANLVLTDGNILEPRTNVRQIFVKGKALPPTSKHTELYETYKARPAK